MAAVRGGNAGNRVTVDEALLAADGRIDAALQTVNQRGPSTLSKAETEALFGVDTLVADFAARAYADITGRTVAAPAVPVPAPAPSRPPRPGRPPQLAGGLQPAGSTPAQVRPDYVGTARLLKEYLRATDDDRDGRLSLRDMRFMLTRNNHPELELALLGNDPNRSIRDALSMLSSFETVIWLARVHARTATGDNRPSLADVDAVIDAAVAFYTGVDADGDGVMDSGASVPAGHRMNKLDEAFFVVAQERPDFGAPPFLATFDHEGDRVESKRRPLLLTGQASVDIRRMVYFVNESDNDNRWPYWAGRRTSRYRLDVDEANALLALIQQRPQPEQSALLTELAQWIRSDAGRAHLEAAAVPIIESYARSLGVQGSFVGNSTAPMIPPW